MALANYEDLEVKLGITISEEDEQERADELLNLSSALVMEELPSGLEEKDAPVVASVIAVEVASRVWINPASLQSESMGSTSSSYSPGLGLVLTEEECSRLRKAGRGGSSNYTMNFR